MSRTLIVVPSKRRASTLADNAMEWLTQLGKTDWRVFIEEEDLDTYTPHVSESDLSVLPTHNKGLGYTKTGIKSYVENGTDYEFIFKIDDDVRGFTDVREKVPASEMGAHIDSLVQRIETIFDEMYSASVISFPYRNELYDVEKEFVFTKRVQTAYMTPVEWFHADEKVSVFEDFAVGLNVIANGKSALRYMHAGIDMGVRVGAGEGGHQSYDRRERAKGEISVLNELYPPLKFREVEKVWGFEPDLRSIKNK